MLDIYSHCTWQQKHRSQGRNKKSRQWYDWINTPLNNTKLIWGPPWSWSYGSWIYNYPCNQYLSPLKLLIRIPLGQGVLDTILCDKVCQWLAAGRWFSLGIPVSSTNKTDRHNITEILLKVAWNTITLPKFDL